MIPTTVRREETDKLMIRWVSMDDGKEASKRRNAIRAKGERVDEELYSRVETTASPT
jgi:hypothetical protein